MTTFFDPAFTGDRWARRYPDADLTGGPDPTAAVDFLASLASPGARVLELAVGGGRVARPLSHRGYRVHGVEASAQLPGTARALVSGDSISRLSASDVSWGGRGL